jgi:hypothetical protein
VFRDWKLNSKEKSLDVQAIEGICRGDKEHLPYCGTSKPSGADEVVVEKIGRGSTRYLRWGGGGEARGLPSK